MIVGLMPVRNEDWILEHSLDQAINWCDYLVVLLHSCSDRSEAIAKAHWSTVVRRTLLISEPSEVWHEMRHRQRLLEVARTIPGMTHIAMIDADECVTQNLQRNVSDEVLKIPAGVMLELPGFNVRNQNQYHADGIWGQRWFSIAFRDSAELHWSGDKFHSREPAGRKWQPYRPFDHSTGGVLHYWGASERRLLAKHALYKLTERLRWPSKPVAHIDRMYSQCVDGKESWTYRPIPRSWSNAELPDLNAEPWQVEQCRKILAEHPELREDLDLFGIV